jgi:hypothetical protein
LLFEQKQAVIRQKGGAAMGRPSHGSAEDVLLCMTYRALVFNLTILLNSPGIHSTSALPHGYLLHFTCNLDHTGRNMATKNGYHNVGPVNKQQRGQGRVSRIPPQTNVVAAASYIRQLFERKNFSYGLMGGLEMLCLGHRREIPDVHIAYDDKDFSRIRAKLEKDHRYACMV